MKTWTLLAALPLLCSCSHKPPVVNGKHREPVNDQELGERLSFCAELGQRLPPPREKAPEAPASAPTPVIPVLLAPASAPASSEPVSSYVMRVHFELGSAAFNPTTEQVIELRGHLAAAKRIEVRARTDAPRPSAADEEVARERALAARHFLISQGADPRVIALNFLSGGDYVADNTTAEGRAENRRVEIEVFED
jgi:outer membrane protein OmpA-like peptidoglycan-associated protein